MAYNPFDDIVDQDPAYMQTGGELQRSVLPQRRVNYDQETFKPVATAIAKGYSLLTPEQDTLDEIEKNKQLRALSTAQALKGTQFEQYAGQPDLPSAVIQSPGIKERLDAAGYKPQGFIEGMSRTGQFMYGEQRQAYEKLASGQQLTDQDRTAIALSPLDSLDFLFPPLAIKKLGSMGLKTVDDVLKSTADIEEVKQIKNYFGGQGFTPAGVVRAPETGGSNALTVQTKKINETIKKIKSGELEPNLGPNKYGLDKIRANEILRGSRKSDESLDVPLEEAQSLIKNVSMTKKIENFLTNTEEQFTRKELEKKFGTDRSTVLTAAKKANYTLSPSTSKYATPAARVRNIATLMNQNKNELGLTKTAKTFGDDREEFVLFDGIFRSLEPENLGLAKDVDKKIFAEKFIDFMKGIDWKTNFAEDLDSIKILDKQRIQGDKIIKEMFDDYKKRFPKQFKDLDYKDFKLNVAHNFPLRVVKGQFTGVGGMKGSSRLSLARTNLGSHAEIENTFKELISAINQQDGKITPAQKEILTSIDDRAKKLGTVAYGKINQPGLENEFLKVGTEKAPGLTSIIESVENYFKDIAGRKKTKFKKFEPKGGATNLVSGFIDEDIPVEIIDELKMKKGGAVRKAIGGTLENINQQNFTPDPAIDGDSAFQQAVKSGNLTAFNPTKLFRFFTDKIPGVYTPNKTKVPPPDRNINTNQANLPGEEGLKDYDFPLQSFTVNKLQNSQTKSAKPQDWINELQGGNASPSAELQDSGLFQYMQDFERYYPDQRMTREQLIDFYEQSPIGNIQVKVKAAPTETPYGMNDQEFMGRPQHQNAGSAPLDNVGTNYREIVISAGKLPGEDKPFIASSHFSDPNVLVFSRVADYKNAGGDRVSVIQELQTDLLTNVRKEQERLAAEIQNQKNKLQMNEERLQNSILNNDEYTKNRAQENINELQKTLPKAEKLAETGLIKPFPLTVAEELIPTYQKQLMDFQAQMDDLMRAGMNRQDPEYLMKINDLQQKQFAVFEELTNLNRVNKFEELTDGVKVPSSSDTQSLQNYAANQSSYETQKEITTFPPIPFNKQADYVDLILKATIKDAENRSINKIAIMPSEVGANNRWNKTGDAKKKFQNLYDKVGVQQLKNIAKKYGGNLEEESIVDTTKGELGLRFLNKGVDGNFQVLRETDIDPSVTIRREDLGPTKPPEGLNAFLNEEILRVARDYGDNEVIFRKEIAPGQTMEYFVNIKKGDVIDERYDLVPLGDADRAENATIIIEEYNPQLVKMNVITLPRVEDAKKSPPMFMFRKKEGGKIPEDRLVSITDIYGDY